uniref:DJ-1/PfpI domain-containing protein n=1 Tax=Cucumis melo TaxID=3656 RepID=A0A9I9DGC1_CUCME
MAQSKSKSVLLLCGDFMEDYEAMVPFQALLAYGVSVDAVCPGKKAGDICRTAVHESLGHQTYSESRGHNFALNATFDEIDFDKYDGLVIPGGRAPEYLAINSSVQSLVRKFSESGKPIATVCHGQLILAAAGLVRGRKCTAYPPVGPVLAAAGASWIEPESLAACAIDGNLITAATYESHPQYIQLFVKALGGNDYMEDYEITVPFQSFQALGCHVDGVCPKKKAGDTCPTAIHDFEGDQTYSEKPGHNFTLTADFEGLDASSHDALVIPGGRAPEYLALNPQVIAIVKEFMEAKKPVASICHGQQILSAAGVLQSQDGESRTTNFLVTNTYYMPVELSYMHFGMRIARTPPLCFMGSTKRKYCGGRKCTAYPAVKLNVELSGATWLEPDPIDRCFTDGNLVTGAAWPGHPQFISQLMTLLGIQVTF